MLYPVFLLLLWLLLLWLPLVLVLMLKVNIIAEYIRDNEDDNVSVSFHALGERLKYKLEIPLISIGSKEVQYKFLRERGKKSTTTGEKKKKTGPIEFLQKINKIWCIYKRNDNLACGIRLFLKKFVVIDEFRLHIREGTGDAALTGFLGGLLWAVSGSLTTFLFHLFKVKSKKYKSNLDIVPDYNVKDFYINLRCIFHTRLVHIILIIAYTLIKRIGTKNFLKSGRTKAVE